MEGIYVNGVPLAEVLENSDITETAKEKRQKFVQVQEHPELHITACAVSQNVDMLAVVDTNSDFFVEPNQQWTDWAETVMECPEELCPPAKPERAWVKVYYNLSGKVDSVSKTIGQVQTIKIPMPLLGESFEECWGEVQLRIKKQIVRNGNMINLENVKLGRHACFDTRVNKWVLETKPIVPKKDAGTHGYIALRLYHQNYLPEIPGDWHFEPLYAAIADKDFYRIDAIWQNEEIVIMATLLDDNSPEIPKFLRR